MLDSTGRKIKVGQRLRSNHGYDVVVRADSKGELYGELVCDPGHACVSMPYALNEGRGYVIMEEVN